MRKNLNESKAQPEKPKAKATEKPKISPAEFWALASKKLSTVVDSAPKKKEKPKEFDFSDLKTKIENYSKKRKEEYQRLFDKDEANNKFFQIESENGMNFMLDYDQLKRTENYEPVNKITDKSLKQIGFTSSELLENLIDKIKSDLATKKGAKTIVDYHLDAKDDNFDHLSLKLQNMRIQSNKQGNKQEVLLEENENHPLLSKFDEIYHFFPKEPLKDFEGPDVYKKLNIDTLFFVFYHSGKNIRRYFAARELKNYSWRYHTKYHTWFQRHEEPKILTEDYEQGTFVFFDYDAWYTRKKMDFTFEYKYLENVDI